MAKTQQLLFAALVASVLLTTCSAATVYDVLAKNNLPRGLLPRGVQSYTLGSDGKLDVSLPSGCTFVVQNYKMQFASDVSGIIQPGSISGLHGLSLQVKYAWLGINQVEMAGNQLTLTIQHNSKISLPVSSFSQSPSCS